jgi:hypothetical protein
MVEGTPASGLEYVGEVLEKERIALCGPHYGWAAPRGQLNWAQREEHPLDLSRLLVPADLCWPN